MHGTTGIGSNICAEQAHNATTRWQQARKDTELSINNKQLFAPSAPQRE
jgi:hypothetical protein